MLRETYEPNYIAVEGVIGVGKTTFAHKLAERIDAELLIEDGFSVLGSSGRKAPLAS